MKRYALTIVIIILATIFLIAISRFYVSKKTVPNNIAISNNNLRDINNSQPVQSETKQLSAIINLPLDNALPRITKKPFGIFVSPHNSPISPERFTGYHTGTDFETTPEEETAPIEVKAIIDGTIINKLSVSGYGGVILEKAEINGQSIIILYGHVDLDSSTKEKEVKKGDSLAILAPANSPKSGYERKHLHLGIIKGNKTDYRGYVPTEKELSNWIDPASVL